MDTPRIEPVDERDSGWEADDPRFRVYLFESGATSTAGASSTYDVVGADLPQVIDWAQRRAGPARTYAIALVDDHRVDPDRASSDDRGLVWLVGQDGNDNVEEDPRGAATQQRMLARRTTPLVVPEADRMPDVPDPDEAKRR